MINNICSTADSIGNCTSIPGSEIGQRCLTPLGYSAWDIPLTQCPASPALSLLLALTGMPVQNGSFPTLCRSKRRPRGQTRTQRIRAGGSAWGRRTRSSPSRSGGSNSRRVLPRPAGSAPGGRHKPLSASARWQRAAPGTGARQLGRARCRMPPFVSRAAGGGQAPSRLRATAVPARGGLQRPSGPARRPHTPASRRYRCLLAAGSRPASPERGCARRAGRGRAGQGRAGGAAGAAGAGRARGRWRGGAGRPRPRPVRGSGSSQPPRPVPTAPVAAAHEAKMVIRVFVASSSGSVAIKKRQQDVVRFLEANRIEFEEVDITMSEEKRQWMYKNIPEDRQPAQGNPLPPQIFSDDRYCGDYDGFFESKESNTVFSFLGLKPTLASK
ncbi:SH3 domain-binding glutamic acid-rich-like protein 2 isoform X2 [Prinia subflava]